MNPVFEHEKNMIFYQRFFAMLLPYHCYNIVLKHVYLILYVYMYFIYFFSSVHFTAGMSLPNQLNQPTIHFLCAFCFLDDDSKHCKLQGETQKKKLFLEQHLCRVSCTIFFCFPFFLLLSWTFIFFLLCYCLISWATFSCGGHSFTFSCYALLLNWLCFTLWLYQGLYTLIEIFAKSFHMYVRLPVFFFIVTNSNKWKIQERE